MFDAFRLLVDPLVNEHPEVLHLSTNAKNTMLDKQLPNFFDAPFPVLPYASNGIPGPAATCLLLHLMAALAHCSRLRMSWEQQAVDDANNAQEQSAPSPELVERINQWRATTP